MELMAKTVDWSLAKKKARTPEEGNMLDMMLHNGVQVKAQSLSAVLPCYNAQK